MHIIPTIAGFLPSLVEVSGSQPHPFSYCRTSTVASRSIACHFDAKSGFLLTVPRKFLSTRKKMMRFRLLALAVCLLGAVSVQAADNFNWQKGTLTATERQKIKEGSTITHNTDASAKDSGNKSDYSSNTTTTKSDNYENYQVYTIESGNIVYVASEHLLFPWSKAADITLGQPVQFAVKGDKMYILDSGGKQHKATLTKTSLLKNTN
jgi:hypothetical protein